MEATYTAMLAEVNCLGERGFRQWIFLDGMAFGDNRQWWGRQARRVASHEGVDFCLYGLESGTREWLAAGALVPAILPGELARIHQDFLGQTIWVRHDKAENPGTRLYAVYGHIEPAQSLKVGAPVTKGQVLGKVADPARAGKSIAPHLHLTLVRVDAALEPSRLDWSLVQNPTEAELLDPLSL